MKKIYTNLFVAIATAMASGVAGAAGTYYNNNSMYQRYNTANMGNMGYNSTNAARGYAAARYGQQNTTTVNRTRTTRTMTTNSVNNNTGAKQGWVFGGGLSRETASWNFEMKDAGSKLHYDGVDWNVLGVNGTYYFGGATPVQANFGARYGVQSGEVLMVDDDISNGGYLVSKYTNEVDDILGYQTGHAISVGTSKGGSQYGFNAALGLTDFFKYGRVKFTPSIGYRYLNYKLKTEKSYGLTMDIFEVVNSTAFEFVTCVQIEGSDEIQCDPFVLFEAVGDNNNTITGRIMVDDELSNYIVVPSDINGAFPYGLDLGGTYYYEQPGTSHDYKTTWAGPYVGLDMEYEINNTSVLTGGIEIGLPIYSSEGNQPYRVDWAHPKSVEDKGSFGDAVHFGLNAMWKTAVSDATMLTLGFTYDYYKVSKATAKTYLSSSWYEDLYNVYEDIYESPESTDYAKQVAEAQMGEIDKYRSAGWVLESKNEVKSLYKSMGIRVGLEMKF